MMAAASPAAPTSRTRSLTISWRYVSYAYGYKSGGLNMSGLPLDAQNQPTLATAVIEDEKNTTYEVGLKYTMLDSRATLNLAGY